MNRRHPVGSVLADRRLFTGMLPISRPAGETPYGPSGILASSRPMVESVAGFAEGGLAGKSSFIGQRASRALPINPNAEAGAPTIPPISDLGPYLRDNFGGVIDEFRARLNLPPLNDSGMRPNLTPQAVLAAATSPATVTAPTVTAPTVTAATVNAEKNAEKNAPTGEGAAIRAARAARALARLNKSSTDSYADSVNGDSVNGDSVNGDRAYYEELKELALSQLDREPPTKEERRRNLDREIFKFGANLIGEEGKPPYRSFAEAAGDFAEEVTSEEDKRIVDAKLTEDWATKFALEAAQKQKESSWSPLTKAQRQKLGIPDDDGGVWMIQSATGELKRIATSSASGGMTANQLVKNTDIQSMLIYNQGMMDTISNNLSIAKGKMDEFAGLGIWGYGDEKIRQFANFFGADLAIPREDYKRLLAAATSNLVNAARDLRDNGRGITSQERTIFDYVLSLDLTAEQLAVADRDSIATGFQEIQARTDALRQLIETRLRIMDSLLPDSRTPLLTLGDDNVYR